MGSYRPTKASPYESESVKLIKKQLEDKITYLLDTVPDAEEIALKNVKSLRRAHLRDICSGNGSWYGITKLTQITEALGVRWGLAESVAP